MEVPHDAETLRALLSWVYCEAICPEVVESGNLELATRILRLAEDWRLRDAGRLRHRLAAGRTAERARGTLAEDVLRAYLAGELGGRLSFCCPQDAHEPLCGGLPVVLRARSSYFNAMLGGSWAESHRASLGEALVDVRWSPVQLGKLLRFLHGGEFVTGPGDLLDAVECAKFFGVPALFAHISDWIACNLTVSTAAELWSFVEAEPLIIEPLGGGYEDVDNADAACFDFAIRNFEDMSRPVQEDGVEEAWIPLHDLSPPLMHRLLASGLVEMHTVLLKGVVKRYAKAICGDEKSQAYIDLRRSLRPPAVLFNREHRASLLPINGIISARSFV